MACLYSALMQLMGVTLFIFLPVAFLQVLKLLPQACCFCLPKLARREMKISIKQLLLKEIILNLQELPDREFED